MAGIGKSTFRFSIPFRIKYCVDVGDPDAVSVAGHPSARRPQNEFSEIKIDTKDWSNLLRVSVLARSMLACKNFANEIADKRYLRRQGFSCVRLYI